jgi:hypothetical protein
VPFRIGFDVGISNFPEALWEFFVDCMFLTDMVMTFFEGYYKDEELVTDLYKIRWHYLKTWFAVDLVSSVPLDLILGLMNGGVEGCAPFPFCGVVEAGVEAKFDNLESLKLFKTLKLVRLLKLARLLKLMKLATSASVKEMIPDNLFTVLSLLFKIVYVAHFICCFWFWMSGVTEDDRIENPDGTITVHCHLESDEDSWVTTVGYEKFDMCDVAQSRSSYLSGHYVTSMYWVIATMMAVGYGDIYAQNPSEMVYSILVQIIGAFMFGMIIATVTTIIENHNPRASAMTRRVEDIKQYMKDRHVPKIMQKKIRMHYEYYFTHKSVFKQQEILREMPGHIRNRVVMFMCKDTIAKIRLFQHTRDGHQDISFIVDIAQHLQPFYEATGGLVVKQGDVVDDMVFLKSGKLECFRDVAEPTIAIEVGAAKGGGFMDAMNHHRRGAQKEAGSSTNAVRLMATKPVIHGYVNEGYHVLSYNCIFQTPSQIGLRATSSCHLLSISRQFLSEMHVLHSQADALLRKEADQQENAINTSIRSQKHDRGTETMMSTLCINLSAVKTEEFSEGDFKFTRDFENEVTGLQLRTRRAGSHATSEPVEGLENKRDLWVRFIVDPNRPAKIQWDLFVGFLIVYGFVTLPYVMAFPSEVNCGETDPNLIIDWLVDILFIIDIVVNFRTAVYCESAELYDTRLNAIANQYLKGWFVIDLPSSLPITQVLELATSTCGDEEANVMMEGPDGEMIVAPRSGGGGASGAKLVKLIRMARLIRLVKLARVLKLGKSFGAMSEVFELSLAFKSFMTLTFALCIVAHYFGCIWHIVKNNVLMGDDDTPKLSAMSPDYAYLTGIYWAFTTMTTVGYGDISPETVPEQLYAIVVMLIGATVFGYIVGSVASLKREMMSSSAKVGEKTSIIMNFLEEQGISKQLSRSVRLHYEYYYAEKSPYDERELIGRLPFKLKRQLLMVVNKDVIRFIPIFDRRKSDFICAIMTRLRPQLCVSQQYVCLSGSNSHEIHFMVMGKAQLIVEHTHNLLRLVTMASSTGFAQSPMARKGATSGFPPNGELIFPSVSLALSFVVIFLLQTKSSNRMQTSLLSLSLFFFTMTFHIWPFT